MPGRTDEADSPSMHFTTTSNLLHLTQIDVTKLISPILAILYTIRTDRHPGSSRKILTVG